MTRQRLMQVSYLFLGTLAMIGIILEVLVSAYRFGAYFDSPILDGLNFFSFFTALSNVLVVIMCAMYITKTGDQSRLFKVLQLTAFASITVTLIVHRLLLAEPYDGVAPTAVLSDVLLHVAVPIAALLMWLVFGLGSRIDKKVAALANVIPILWVALTLFRAWLTGRYPYSFLDPNEVGFFAVALNILAVFGMYTVVVVVIWAAEVERKIPLRT